MRKTLGGSLFIINGIKYDYCFKEAIECLCEFCDKVSVVDVGSTDGSIDVLKKLEDKHKVLNVTYLDTEEWLSQHGREKLAYFSNVAIEKLDTDYNFSLQADEILHQNSYDWVHKAINSELAEAYMCSRINLWGDQYHQLNVPQERKPCSSQIIRLAKTKYRSCGDAESIDAQCIYDFVKHIQIWHYGFIRKREVMIAKIINMQKAVFLVQTDPKLDNMEVFDPSAWFDPKTDLRPIDSPHPKIMKEWISTRP